SWKSEFWTGSRNRWVNQAVNVPLAGTSTDGRLMIVCPSMGRNDGPAGSASAGAAGVGAAGIAAGDGVGAGGAWASETSGAIAENVSPASAESFVCIAPLRPRARHEAVR